MRTPEIIAGELSAKMHERFAGSNWTTELPGHLATMLGDNEWRKPLWRDRIMAPDGRRFQLERFEDYLMRPNREGLGFDNWHTVHVILETQGVVGRLVVKKIRAEVADYDERVRADRKRLQSQTFGKARNRKGGRPTEKVAIGYLSKNPNTAARLIARLKRDAPEIADDLFAQWN